MSRNYRSLVIILASVGFLALMACDSKDDSEGNQSGTINVQISGEELAVDGIPFPEGGEVTIADGWEIQFKHVLITVGKVWVSENPDKAPSDQSQTDAVVAEVSGPWAVDLHQEGTAPGAGGEGKAIPIVSISKQNKKGDKPFASDQRYAFSYDVVAASPTAIKLNFQGDSQAEAAYAEMVAKGYAVLYVGTATFRGTSCQNSDAAYDFEKLPKTVDFKLGFSTPTSYINCQNQDNQGDAFPDEEYQRGIAILKNTASTAQLTFHLEHPFYSDVLHEPTLYFDQMAARLVGKPQGTPVTIDELVGVDPSALADASGVALPWRVCNGSELSGTKQRSFGVGSIALNPSADPSAALRDYRDYVQYVQSSQGHLNGGEGLCFVKRNYPAPL